MTPTKACPVILRSAAGPELLAFRHPLADLQLVKGTIEAGEALADAAIRELREEAGIASARLVRDLGIWRSGHESQVWSFHQLSANQPLPDAWSHQTDDDGGHVFRFFWHPIGLKDLQRSTGSNLLNEWHPVFVGALAFIERQLRADRMS